MIVARPEGTGSKVAYSVAEVIALTGLGRDSVYASMRSGKLIAHKLGKRTLITADDLRNFLASLPRFGEAE